MNLGNISVSLPSDRFTLEKDTYIGNEIIKVTVNTQDQLFSRPKFVIRISDYDLPVMEILTVNIFAEFPVSFYLTKPGIELSVEFDINNKYLIIETYDKDIDSVKYIFEILAGIRFGTSSVNISEATVKSIISKCTAAWDEEKDKEKREYEKRLQRGANLPGGYAKYDNDISFDLPRGYEFYWKDLGDGEKGGRITTDIAIDDFGEKNPGFMITLADRTDPLCRQDFFELYVKEIANPQNNVSLVRLSHDPETVLMTSMINMQIFSAVVHTVGVNVLVKISNNKLLNMGWGESDKKAKITDYQNMEKILKVVRALRIQGKPVQLEKVDAQSLWTQLYPQGNDGPVHEISLGIKVSTSIKKANGDEYNSEWKVDNPVQSAGLNLTDTQKEYLSVINDLIGKYGPVSSSTVAEHMHKSTSAVRSAVSILMKKGVLNKNDDGKIVIAEGIELDKKQTIEGKSQSSSAKRPTETGTKKQNVKSSVPKKTGTASKKVSAANSEFETFIKSMEARLLPGEKELPAEAFNRNIDFRAGSIAENGIRFNLLKNCGPVIDNVDFNIRNTLSGYLEIPEGVTEIGISALSNADFQIVKLPRSLRILKDWAFSDCLSLRKIIFQEGIKEIGAYIFEECPDVTEINLPSTVEIIDAFAFSESINNPLKYHITVYMTEASVISVYNNAIRKGWSLPDAKHFIIDGRGYPSLEYFLQEREKKRQAEIERQRREDLKKQREQHEAMERQRKAMLKREEEAKRKAQRESILKSISQLEKERDSVKGIFAGMKRNKIQKEIDELKAMLQNI